MSKINHTQVKCPKCGKAFEVKVFSSVNTDYSPNVPEQIINGELFRATCPSCGNSSNLSYNVLYNDMNHGMMVWVIHPGPNYDNTVNSIRQSSMIMNTDTRLVHSMQQLGEKVSCLEAGRDDRVIEVYKAFVKVQIALQRPNFEPEHGYYTFIDNKEAITFYDGKGNSVGSLVDNKVYELLKEACSDELKGAVKMKFPVYDENWGEQFLLSISQNDSIGKPLQPKKENVPEQIFCRKCGSKLLEDSVFCSKCGTPVHGTTAGGVQRPVTAQNSTLTRQKASPSVAKTPASYASASSSRSASPDKNSDWYIKGRKNERRWMTFVIAACIIFVFVIIAAVGGTNDSKAASTTNVNSTRPAATPTPVPTPTPLPLPESGKVFVGESLTRDSMLTIRSSSGSSCFIKLKDKSDKTVFSFFVRAGDTVEMSVPSGTYRVYFAYGDNWYGTSKCFGEETSYSMDEEYLDFTNYTWEYTLYPVTNGNFTDTTISADDF